MAGNPFSRAKRSTYRESLNKVVEFKKKPLVRYLITFYELSHSAKGTVWRSYRFGKKSPRNPKEEIAEMWEWLIKQPLYNIMLTNKIYFAVYPQRRSSIVVNIVNDDEMVLLKMCANSDIVIKPLYD